MTAAWEQPGRTDSAAYATADTGQSLADMQRLEAKARELAADAFTKQTDKARDWLRDAKAGEGSVRAIVTIDALVDAALCESCDSSADLSLVRDRLRETFVDECADDFLDAAAEDAGAI